MDSLKGFEEDPDDEDARHEESAIEPPPGIGSDERRMHVRAYNYWVSLLDGRAYPSIEDLEPQDLGDFEPHSVLLDFTCGSENPAIAYIGRELRDECGLPRDIRTIGDVPSRSLLSRLTDHYLQIIANCAPIGFEAEFESQRGGNTLYRGILMPLSSDGDTIDFIYGVINWKEVADGDTSAGLAREVDRVVAAAGASPAWADGPNAEPLEDAFGSAVDFDAPTAAPDDGGDTDDSQESLDFALGPDAGLADRLSLARETADAARGADARSRSALYRALGRAYDFALAAGEAPGDYAEILEDAGIKAQARAPMTPIVKLVFGIDYDKTRLTEFAAALAYGRRMAVEEGAFAPFLDRFDGGLKAMVAAERAARRATPKKDRTEAARTALRAAPALAHLDIEAGGKDFVLLVARREEDGRLAVVAPVAEDKGLIERALRKSVTSQNN